MPMIAAAGADLQSAPLNGGSFVYPEGRFEKLQTQNYLSALMGFEIPN
jgi:hypothetical protein